MCKTHNIMVKIHTQDKLLSLLLSNKREHFSIREISKRIKIDYKTVYLLVQNLIQNKIILSQKAGQTTLCSINLRSFNSDIFRAESLRKEELLKNNNFFVAVFLQQQLITYPLLFKNSGDRCQS